MPTFKNKKEISFKFINKLCFLAFGLFALIEDWSECANLFDLGFCLGREKYTLSLREGFKKILKKESWLLYRRGGQRGSMITFHFFKFFFVPYVLKIISRH